ncbi:MAG: S8 family serine peptidase [Candidatus Kryptoniota bacterium]
MRGACFLILFMSTLATAQSKYWIFFKDKPDYPLIHGFSKSEDMVEYALRHDWLTRRALERRAKVLPRRELISILDYPVNSSYLDALRSKGALVVGISRWFNAAAVIINPKLIPSIESLPFVIAIKQIIPRTAKQDVKLYNAWPLLFKTPFAAGDSASYGPSFVQYELSGIPYVHALGIDGTGVVIGMLDTGFRWRAHSALMNIKVVGERDFIQGDSVTSNQPGDASDQDSHGTSTLSLLGGYFPGNLIGVSYGSQFLLAKTEYVPITDLKVEEDWWVEGLEWEESRGADVVSSSVGYNVFVDSNGVVDSADSYFWSRGDFNGKVSLASRAAAIAARLGVVVVQAMGNEGNGNGKVGTMLVPADADSIISVGAVDRNGNLASFSSTGPTNDGRTKPDLVADGVGDYVATVPGPDTYAYESGTSFSTPITAGIAALILSVRPDYSPMQVINLLEASAVEHADTKFPDRTVLYPNNFYGYGIVNAWKAIQLISGPVAAEKFSAWQSGSYLYIAIRVFSKNGISFSRSSAYYSTNDANYIRTEIFPTDTINQVAFKIFNSGQLNTINFYFNIIDSSGDSLSLPYHPAKSVFTLKNVQPPAVNKLFVSCNFPNPFTKSTSFVVNLPTAGYLRILVYNSIGIKLKTIYDGYQMPGSFNFIWNGDADSNLKAASGVYFIVVETNGSVAVLKSMLLK